MFPVYLLSIWLIQTVAGQCPAVSGPCRCQTTIYEPISITCSRGSDLASVVQSISAALNTRIDRLAIIDTPISALPANAFSTLQVVNLMIKRAGLTRIDENAFNGPMSTSLSELSLENNALGGIPQTGVTQLRNLRKLLLKNNKISMVPPRAFTNYLSKGNLQKLDLSENRISGIGTVSLEGLTNLREISFETNLFTAIPTQGLGTVRSTLEDLNLGLNKISDVPLNALDFPNLKSLSLEFNNIPAIQAPAFRGTPKLLYLYVGGNKFVRFDPNMFRYIQDLEILGIGEMSIQELPANAFQFTPKLRRLEMSEAAVGNIQPGTFQRIRNSIRAIVMNRNQLTRIRQDMFQGLNVLQSLDIQGNQLRSIDNSAFANLPGLRHLDMSNNQLRTLASQTFINTFLTSVQGARTLYVCGNPWVCDDRLEWFRQWLRQDMTIIIDKIPGCLAECMAPEWLLHVPLRDPNPVTLPPQPIEDDPARRPVVSSIGWIILAVILAILLSSIFLLSLVRWFVGRKRRQEKEREEEERILRSSITSGYRPGGSVVGSVYPAPQLDLDLPPATTLDNPERPYWSGY